MPANYKEQQRKKVRLEQRRRAIWYGFKQGESRNLLQERFGITRDTLNEDIRIMKAEEERALRESYVELLAVVRKITDMPYVPLDINQKAKRALANYKKAIGE